MKKLLLLFVVLFLFLFTFTTIAQKDGAIGKSIEYSFPEKIQRPMGEPLPAGTYSIGSGGYFTTIQSAFNKLSTDGVAGAVNLELIDNLYTAPTDSFGFFLNGPIPGAGLNSRVTIKPAENKNVTIQGDGFGTITFLNTSYVTVDGINLTGATTLTIHTLPNSTFLYNEGIVFFNNCDHNVMQNITFINEDITRISGSCFWGNNTSSEAPDSNLIQNNFVKQAGIGFFISVDYTTIRGIGNIIRGNKVGSETDSLIAWGIQVENCQNSIIEDNIVQNLRFYNNYSNPGINSWCGNGDIIRNNVVHNIHASGGIFGGMGILLSGITGKPGSNNLVYNNMVYDIRSSSTVPQSTVAGIQMWQQINPKIYYNSVYLNGNGNGANSDGSAALYIYYACTNVEAKDNILVNIRDESPYCASAIYDNTIANLTSDYNDLFYQPGSYSALVRIGGTKYNTLAGWQATGKDLNSISEMPNYIDPYLHINDTLPTYLEKGATPIVGIESDFDGDIRNIATPDIGADEFNGFTFEDPLPPGTYTIGTGGNFTTIQAAFNKLSTDGVAGNVTLELIDDLYIAPTDSFGFKLNGPIPGAGPTSRVTIKPAENKNVTIEGSGGATISFLKTRYVTIDGVGITPPTTLTIRSLVEPQFTWVNSAVFFPPAAHNIVENVTFNNENYLKGVGLAFMSFVSTTSPLDSNLIQNNFIQKASIGIYISGWSGIAEARYNIVRGNIIGSETDSLITWGIQIEGNDNSIIENNRIDNIKQQFALNIITPGINIVGGNSCIVRNNVVHKVRSHLLYGSTGILLSGDGSFGSGNNNLVCNNMVYDIQSTSVDPNSRVAGIQLWYQSNPKIYYNSVNLSGTGGTNPGGSAALFIVSAGTVTNLDIKNNILVNTRDESPYCASSICDYSSAIFTSDYNDLYYDDTNPDNCLVKIGANEYLTLANWQLTGKDLNSITEMPPFISPDLHIDSLIFTLIDEHATPIAAITTDIDNEPRDPVIPDIGADEYVYVPVELTFFLATSTGSKVILNWGTATEINNSGFSIERKSEILEFSEIGFVPGFGTTTEPKSYSYTDSEVFTGKHTYRLKQIDFDGSYEYSPEVEIEVSAPLEFSLEQNFPNPFNPVTNIKYQIPELSFVMLNVYDITGNEISKIVNEQKSAGTYNVEFDATTLPSGVYFYQLKAGSFVETKKMILLK